MSLPPLPPLFKDIPQPQNVRIAQFLGSTVGVAIMIIAAIAFVFWVSKPNKRK